MIKGITTPGAARLAVQHGADGIIVSNYGGPVGPGTDAPILTLPHIVDAVDGKVPVLVDGSFRRGTDILKALAFGARSVLVGRPAMWGLAAYGADGVQGVVEMLQTELARYMGMCGKSRVGMLDRTILRVHRRVAARDAGEAFRARSQPAPVRGSAPWVSSRPGGGRACHGARRSPGSRVFSPGRRFFRAGCRRRWIRARSRITSGCPGSTR